MSRGRVHQRAAEREDRSPTPSPSSSASIPSDTRAIYVEMRERDIYFLETIVKGYDGIAHVRRDWLARNGRRFVRILVPPGLEGEVLRVLERVKRYIPLGEIRTEL